jgi:hypothetical protein
MIAVAATFDRNDRLGSERAPGDAGPEVEKATEKVRQDPPPILRRKCDSKQRCRSGSDVVVRVLGSGCVGEDVGSIWRRSFVASGAGRGTDQEMVMMVSECRISNSM